MSQFAFRPQDVRLLYGKTLFRVGKASLQAPEETPQEKVVAEPVEATPPTTKPEAVAQPMPVLFQPATGNRVSILVSQTAFQQTELRDLLNKITQALGLAGPEISVGAIAAPVVAEQLTAAPGRCLLVFGAGLLSGSPAVPVYQLPALEDMQRDVAVKRQAWEYMKTFKNSL